MLKNKLFWIVTGILALILILTTSGKASNNINLSQAEIDAADAAWLAQNQIAEAKAKLQNEADAAWLAQNKILEAQAKLRNEADALWLKQSQLNIQ